MTDHREPDPKRQCHHGTAHLPGEWVSNLLYDDVYQKSQRDGAL
jgi:hypothetical protein